MAKIYVDFLWNLAKTTVDMREIDTENYVPVTATRGATQEQSMGWQELGPA